MRTRAATITAAAVAVAVAMAAAGPMAAAPPARAVAPVVRAATTGSAGDAQDVPPFADLAGRAVSLKPSLAGAHPRVFVTAGEIDHLRERARSTHRSEWQAVLSALPAVKSDPPPPPGPQERRSQNNVAFAIAGVSLAWAIEQQPAYLAAARKWVLAAIDYEPWGYTYNKPNVDLAAGHLLYAIGWAYDLLYHDLSPAERDRIRASLERHARLVYDAFALDKPGKRLNFTQNHDFIPTSGLAVTALALMGESAEAPKWAALARAHHYRTNSLLSPDGYYYEGMEYWIFSIPWLVHFYDAWEHATGESLWELGPARHWKYYLAHSLLPDGQNVFDFGDIWEGPLTRAREGAEYGRVFPGGNLQSNFNVMYRVAAHFNDRQAQAVAARYAAAGHSNLEEYWTLIWRQPSLAAASMTEIPLTWHFEDMGVVYHRTSWNADATAFAFKAGAPEGRRATSLVARVPEWRLSSGHAQPDTGSFIIWARGRYLTGDTGYAGQSQARHHNTITIGGAGQGLETDHDVWRDMDQARLGTIRITSVRSSAGALTVTAELAGAYRPELGLTRFQRTFAFIAPDQFSVADEIHATGGTPIQWYLQSDTPVVASGDGYLVGGAEGTPALRVRVQAGDGARFARGATALTAPGQPGSITSGTKDQRGYHLEVETPAAPLTRIRAELRVVGDRR